MRRLAARAVLVAFAALTTTVVPTSAGAHTHARAGQPGPAILYAPPARSPQLENTGVWHAPPTLVSGATAYRRGEFLYQAFVYDDHGANTVPNAGPPAAFLGASGDYTYPTDPTYARNAADLVELRVKPLADATAIRLTYNTMLDPRLTATTIALGSSPSPLAMPHGANAKEPARFFVTVHGTSADIVDAQSGDTLAAVPQVRVDTYRRQIEVRIPYTVFDPRGLTAVRMAAATGLWDVANDRYLVPQATADASHPGGAGDLAHPPAFFDVAFRDHEPLDGSFYPVAKLGNVWREYEQADVLASGDLSPFFATIDFAKLQSRRTDDSAIPRSGFIDRIYASHFEDAQGRGSAASLQPENCLAGCVPTYAGRLQPYEIYVPAQPRRPGGYGLTLDLHGAGVTYNEDLGTQRQLEFAQRSVVPSIVLSPEGRGEAYWWYGEGLADVFEAWADVARHYPIDRSHVAITGASMGGYGSLKIAAQWPDLFAAAAPHIPCPSAGVSYDGTNAPGGLASFVYPMIPSLRHVPVSIWRGDNDPVCGGPGPLGQDAIGDELDALGYRYSWWSFIGMGHVLLPTYEPQAEYLDARTVERNPAHVTYVLNAEMDQPALGLNADHPYWISDARLRDPSIDPPLGTVDVVSRGFGQRDPLPRPTETGSGVLTCGGVCYSGPPGPLTMTVFPYTTRSKAWGPTRDTRPRDELDITATNVSSLTIDVRRARVSCGTMLHVQTDGPIRIRLAGCRGRGAERSFR